MSRSPRIGDIVEVEWDDSERVGLGWRDRAEYLKVIRAPQAYRTAGYWLGGAAGRVVVSLNVDPRNGRVGDCMAIPRSCVRTTTVLGRAHKRTRKALR